MKDILHFINKILQQCSSTHCYTDSYDTIEKKYQKERIQRTADWSKRIKSAGREFDLIDLGIFFYIWIYTLL